MDKTLESETLANPKPSESIQETASKTKVVNKTNRKPKKAVKIKAKRTRVTRSFPASSFDEALEFAQKIFEVGKGAEVRRLTLFNALAKSPESSASRMMVTNANKYGLITGGYSSDVLALTEDGRLVADEEKPLKLRNRAKIKLAIESIDVFSKLYTKFVSSKLPTKPVLVDAAKSFGEDDDASEEAVDTFIVNLRSVGLLQLLSGAERIVTIDHSMEGIPPETTSQHSAAVGERKVQVANKTAVIDISKLENVCFFVAPIGEEDSEHRKHSDMVLGSIVEPALEPLGLKVVRADGIASPGMISRQVLDYILNAKLVIVDLSYHNPNVFYELAIRHMLKKPIVQLIRKADKIPFDISNSRTITIDTTDIYTLVPRIETYKSEIATQVRHALENPEATDNPISTFYPAITVSG